MRNKLRRTKSGRDATFSTDPRTGKDTHVVDVANSRAGGSGVEQLVEAETRRAPEPRIAPIFLCGKRNQSRDRGSDRDPDTVRVPPERCDDEGWRGQQRPAPLLMEGRGSWGGRQLSPSAVHSILQEIQTSNTAFPVQIQFDSLQKRARDSEANYRHPSSVGSHAERKRKQAGESPQAPKRLRSSPSAERSIVCTRPGVVGVVSPANMPLRRNKLSRRYRFKQQSGTEEAVIDGSQSLISDVQSKEFSFEDVLWTDKYSPQCSSQIIGNSVSVNKLHSWLKKWKLQAECEERTKTEERNHDSNSSDLWDCGDFQGEAALGGNKEKPPGNTVLLTGPSGVGKTASVYACAQELGFKVFEVNCSSQRSGRLILSQLKEATQSHLVETSGKDPLKPAYFSNYSDKSFPAKREPVAGKSLPSKNVISISKRKKFGRFSHKEKANPAAVTLAKYFTLKAKADLLHSAGPSPPDKPDSKKSGNPAAGSDHTEEHNKRTATSLILFEEVDVIFEDDVGFLQAIKTFMATTKRPVILTTNDPTFRERFGCSLEEIYFKSPSAMNVCSYLQLVCLAEGAKLWLDDALSLVSLSRGDVRRCLLQLQLWVKSTPKPKHAHWDQSSDCQLPPHDTGCTAMTLGLHLVTPNRLLHLLKSWTEPDVKELMMLLTESWRGNHPLLYSNLQLLLSTSRNKHSASASLTENPERTFLNARISNCKSEKKACKASTVCIDALANFFDILSFLDTTKPAGERLLPGGGEHFVWTGAEMKDGLLDEMREEEEEGRSCGRERLLEICAATEGLGFHGCWEHVSGAWEEAHRCRRNAGQLGELTGEEKFPWSSSRRSLSCSSRPLCAPHVTQRRFKLSRTVLGSPFFSLLGNREAVSVDYMPALRFMGRAKGQTCANYLTSKKLGLSKSSLLLLAEDFPHSSLDNGC